MRRREFVSTCSRDGLEQFGAGGLSAVGPYLLSLELRDGGLPVLTGIYCGCIARHGRPYSQRATQRGSRPGIELNPRLCCDPTEWQLTGGVQQALRLGALLAGSVARDLCMLWSGARCSITSIAEDMPDATSRQSIDKHRQQKGELLHVGKI